jgi:hypothetical protein
MFFLGFLVLFAHRARGRCREIGPTAPPRGRGRPGLAVTTFALAQEALAPLAPRDQSPTPWQRAAFGRNTPGTNRPIDMELSTILYVGRYHRADSFARPRTTFTCLTHP